MLRHPETIAVHNVVQIDTNEQRDWVFPLHVHDRQLEISFVQEGSGTCYYDGRTYNMRAGDVVVKDAGQIHAEKADIEKPLRQICISFSGINEIQERPNCFLPKHAGPIFHNDENTAVLSELFNYLAANWQDETKSRICLHCQSALLEIVSDIVEHQVPNNNLSKTDVRAMNTVNEIVEWIDKHYSQKITLASLAEQFFISPYYLDRKFKEYTGYSVNQYVIDRRMGEAQRLLIFETASIKEISLAVGYDNLQYFYATFRKYTGITPLAFRERFQ